MAYTVLAKELDVTNGAPGYTVIDLTNRVPFNFTAGPRRGADEFLPVQCDDTFFLVTTPPRDTNFLASIHFELYNLTGNGDLTVQSNALPLAPPFFQSSQQPGRAAEFIYIRTNSVLTNLVAHWYLGVPNHETNPINFTILAVMDTNICLSGVSRRGGAGGDARWRALVSDVYHVINLNDSGPWQFA